MLAVLIFWIVLLSIFLALGDATILSYNKITKSNAKSSLTDTFFIGLATGSVIACTFSLFAPLSVYIFLTILACTSSYWLIQRKRLSGFIRNAIRIFRDFPIWVKFLYFLFAFVILFHASAFSTAFDQFLYHQQHIKWLQEYGVVNGLANLHIRFGFNSSSLSLTGLFVYRPELSISFTALNGLSMLVFSSWLIAGIGKNKNTISTLAYCVTLATLVDFYMAELSSTSTDILVNVLVAYLLLNSIFNGGTKRFYLPLAILPVFCVTLKLSSAPIVILSLFSFYSLFKAGAKRHLYYLPALAALIAVPWLIQNILLSGYLVFPFADIDLFSFDWKVPHEIVAAEKVITYNWARGSEAGSFPGWVPNWWAHLPIVFRLIYALSFASVIAFVFSYRKLTSRPLVATACITAIAGVLFCFLTAPALRFSYGFMLPAIFTILLPLENNKNSIIRKGMISLQYAFLILFAVSFLGYIRYKTVQQIEFDSSFLKAQYIKPFPLSSATNRVTFDTVRARNVDIFVPQQGRGGRCFDQKLPCAPFVRNNLELRGETLKDGFRIKTE